MIDPNARISREGLAQLLQLSQASRNWIEANLLGSPYCQLPAQGSFYRYAYIALWDEAIWIVVLYNNAGAYSGYDLSY